MRNKLCLLLLAALLLLVGCESGTDSNGNEKTAPLDRIIDALQTSAVSTYESAFPPAFCTQYQAASGDLREYLELLLTSAVSFNLDRYGKDVKITYALNAAEPYDVSSLEPNYRSVTPDFVYTLPMESVSDAAEIAVTVYFEGSYLAEEFDLTYTVLCIDGNWVLHPKHFSTVLKQ